MVVLDVRMLFAHYVNCSDCFCVYMHRCVLARMTWLSLQSLGSWFRMRSLLGWIVSELYFLHTYIRSFIPSRSIWLVGRKQLREQLDRVTSAIQEQATALAEEWMEGGESVIKSEDEQPAEEQYKKFSLSSVLDRFELRLFNAEPKLVSQMGILYSAKFSQG